MALTKKQILINAESRVTGYRNALLSLSKENMIEALILLPDCFDYLQSSNCPNRDVWEVVHNTQRLRQATEHLKDQQRRQLEESAKAKLTKEELDALGLRR